MSKYTIMVPVYNKLEYLKKYFNYILNQTYDDYEIVVVDDKSDDGSYEYLNSINSTNLRVYQNEQNMGLGATRNVLLQYARGEYVLFVDPDDYIEVNLLTKIDEENEDIDIIRFQNVIEPMSAKQKEIEAYKDKYRLSCTPTDIISGEEALLKWHLGERKINTMPWTYAIKKSLYDDVVYPNTSILEDFAITPYLIAKAKRIKAISFVGYHYLQYDDSLSKHNNDLAYAKMKIELFEKIIELTQFYINKTDISSEAKQIFIDDINNRYLIRKQKVDLMEKTTIESKRLV